jgi:molybdopterin-containing oxidoreductase family membrane subunit
MAEAAHAHSSYPPDPLEPVRILEGEQTDLSINQSLFDYVWKPTGRGWLMALSLAGAFVGLLGIGIVVTIARGIGMWGNNIPIAWAFGIINFVWWIGIGHAGTLISAILLLFQQKWRTSINRFSEAMTLFAVMCAGMFPLLHLGRPWFAYWLFPYPSRMRLWPNFKSPLIWDVFAVSTYLTTSLLFWFLGLVPDLASLRDSSKTKLQRYVYGALSLGWRGSAKHWNDWRSAYLLLAGLATPLVLSVHTIVSFDFAISILPGWHTTIFPPYFVAGAVFSGFAMVVTLIIPARKYMKFEHVVTIKHLENMCKVMLATGWIVTYGYMMEHFIAWYSGNEYEFFVFLNRRAGPYAPVFWLMVFCNCVVPNIFWSKKARTNLVVMWIAALLINVGMWCERFIIIVTSLHRDFLPSSWRMYAPTWVDWSIYLGTIGFFCFMFLLFLRFLPAIAATEIKELRHELHEEAHAASTAGAAQGGGH